jgi:GT2 family glycosyltransferase
LKETGNELPSVSVIIVNLNGRKWIKRLVDSVLASDYPKDKLELVFVDNGSTDGSVILAKDLCSRKANFQIIQNVRNIGWSPANNQGLQTAKGDIIVCISNDMEVETNWIKEIVRVMESDRNIGLVQCNSLSMMDRKTPDSGMNYLDRFGFAYSYAPSKADSEVFFAEGMAFAVKQEVIRIIGGLDEYFFMEYDDMDYSWRARLAGFEIFFIPAARVYHARGGTVGATYFERINNVKWYTRNHIVTLIKNYERNTLLKLSVVVLAVEVTKILYLLIAKKNWKLANAASKGILNVISDSRVILKKRMEIQKSRKVSDKEIMRSMHPFNPWLLRLFLVWQAKGKRLAIEGKPPMNEVKSN